MGNDSSQIETRDVPPLELRAAFRPGSVDVEKRTAELVFATGARVRRGFYEAFDEELSLDPKHVRMARLASGRAPLLDSHGRFDLESQIGVVERSSVNGKEGRATVRFSKRADVEPIFQDVVDGIIANVSVGYRVHRYERVQEGDSQKGTVPVYRAVDWEPYEVSLVPLPADAGASVRAQAGTAMPCQFLSRKEISMDPTAPDPTDPVANVDPAVVAERERTSTILQAVRAAKLEQTFADRLIAEGVPVDKARVAILGELARRDEEMHIDNHTRFDDSGSREAGARRVQLMAEALAARFGGPKPSDRAEQYLRMSVVDMARHSLELRGMSTRLLSRGQLIARGLHSTSDFPVLLTETGNRMLRHGYASYQGGVRQICRQSSAPDFRAKSLLMLGEAPELRKVNEHGEFTRGSMASSKESYALATFGRVFGITRQALVNDDLGAFTDLAARLGRSAAEFVASQLVTLLTSNPAMSDGVALFAAPHANLGTAAVISVASLGEALKLMRLQKGLDRKTPIDVTPRFIVVPAALEVVARQHVAQINATKPGDTNPFTSANLEVVVDPRLDADSDTAWYLAADPSAFDTIEFSFLDGNEGPELESRAGFDVDGLEVRVRLDFGAGVIDHRGLVKNAGA